MNKCTVYLSEDQEIGYYRAKVVRFPIAVGDYSRKVILIDRTPEISLYRAFDYARQFWGSPDMTTIFHDEVLNPVDVEFALSKAFGEEWNERWSWDLDTLVGMISEDGWEQMLYEMQKEVGDGYGG